MYGLYETNSEEIGKNLIKYSIKYALSLKIMKKTKLKK